MSAAHREQDARDYADAETARRARSNRDDANTKGPHMLRKTIATAALALTAALLTACGTTPDTSASPTPAAGAPAAATSKRDLTKATFDLTWDGNSEAQRTTLCNGLIILGPERSAQEMQNGADGSTDLDWDYMTELLAAECDNR